MSEKPALLGPLVARLKEAVARSPSGAAALAWPEVAGSRVAAHAWVEGIEGDTVEIAVDSTVWSHHLQLMAVELLARLRETAGLPESVSRIRFRPAAPAPDASRDTSGGHAAEGGAGPQGGASRKSTSARPGPDLPAPPDLSATVRAELEAVLARVEDPQIARALGGALGIRVSAKPQRRAGLVG